MNILLGVIPTILAAGFMLIFFVNDYRIKEKYTRGAYVWRAILNMIILLGLWLVIILYQIYNAQIQNFSKVSFVLSACIAIWTSMDIGKETIE